MVKINLHKPNKIEEKEITLQEAIDQKFIELKPLEKVLINKGIISLEDLEGVY